MTDEAGSTVINIRATFLGSVYDTCGGNSERCTSPTIHATKKARADGESVQVSAAVYLHRTLDLGKASKAAPGSRTSLLLSRISTVATCHLQQLLQPHPRLCQEAERLTFWISNIQTSATVLLRLIDAAFLYVYAEVSRHMNVPLVLSSSAELSADLWI